jgi:hypothetical protein
VLIPSYFLTTVVTIDNAAVLSLYHEPGRLIPIASQYRMLITHIIPNSLTQRPHLDPDLLHVKRLGPSKNTPQRTHSK